MNRLQPALEHAVLFQRPLVDPFQPAPVLASLLLQAPEREILLLQVPGGLLNLFPLIMVLETRLNPSLYQWIPSSSISNVSRNS